MKRVLTGVVKAIPDRGNSMSTEVEKSTSQLQERQVVGNKTEDVS